MATKSTATQTPAQTPEGHLERVVTPSLRADGTPMQSEGWVRLTDERDDAEV